MFALIERKGKFFISDYNTAIFTEMDRVTDFTVSEIAKILYNNNQVYRKYKDTPLWYYVKGEVLAIMKMGVPLQFKKKVISQSKPGIVDEIMEELLCDFAQ